MARQSDRFYREIRTSHRVKTYVDVISTDQEVVRLQVTDGQVDVDRTAQYRRHITLTCVDPSGKITPRKNGELLTPYGTEILPYRGVQYSNDPEDFEVAPLGVFRLSRATIVDGLGGSAASGNQGQGDPVITLEGFDLSRTISRDKFKVPYVVSAGTNALTAIKQIVQMTLPDVTYDSISTPVATVAPLLYDAGSDPWDAVTSLAKSMGCEIYFDVEGRLCIIPPHDINALPTPDFTYIEGDHCTMLDIGREYNDENVFNGVIVSGQAVGDDLPAVRGEAWDENPTSPTYRLGPYGEVPTFVTDELVKTEDQAQAVARSTLATILGASSQITITGIVNPSYECNDVIGVKREKSGVDGLYAIDAFMIPLLSSNPQSLTLREQRPSQ